MKTINVNDLTNLVGQSVIIEAWVETVRNQKKMQFLILRDNTGQIQSVNEKLAGREKITAVISGLTSGSTIRLTGRVIENSSVKLGGIEIAVESVEILSLAEAPLPLSDGATLDNRLDWRFLDLRKPANRLIFMAQTVAEQAMRTFWQERGFIEIHSPKFMEAPSESGAELFKVEYFDKTAYLAQSPQFYKQMAMAAGLDRIFEVGPVFRANPSFTSRHDTEFTSVDVEVSWIDSHEEIMKLEEEWLHYILTTIKETLGSDIERLYGVEVVIPKLPFPRVTMEEAYAILKRSKYTVTRAAKGDLDPGGEKALAGYIQNEFGHDFVFVKDYPASVRPFYHMRHADNSGLTKSFDLLWKGLEITTGAQREHRYDILTQQVLEKGLTLKPIQHYLNFFKFGCPPHGGYGFGLSRMLMILLGIKNVREATYVYRGPRRLSP